MFCNVSKKGYNLHRTGTVVFLQQGEDGENTGEDAFRMNTISVFRLKVFYYVTKKEKEMKIKNTSNAETIRTLLARVLKEDSWNLFPGIRKHCWRACGYKGIPTKEFHKLFDSVFCQFKQDWQVRWQYGV